MLQFNLLPDVKKEYIKAKRTKRMIITISMLVSGSALVLLFLLFSYVQFAQKKSINDLSKDIQSGIANINSTSGLNEMLTIQNQLNTLPELAEGRPEMSRIFDYIRSVTPVGVYVSNFEVDVVSGTMEISGTADSLALINQYADTLKFAKYTTGEEVEGQPFSNVLTSLSRNDDNSSYTIEMNFDPILFNNTQEVTITIEQSVTTRSVIGQPNLSGEDEPLFIDDPSSQQGGDQ